MKILQIIPNMARGGAERQCVNLSLGLARRGHDVHVALLNQVKLRVASSELRDCNKPLSDELLDGGVKVHCIGKRFKIDPLAFIRLCDVISEIRPDVAHTWLFAPNCYGRAAAKLCGVPKIYGNERCLNPWKSKPFELIDSVFNRFSTAVTTNTKSFEKNGYIFIPNGVDVNKLIDQSGRESRADILSEFGLKPTAFVIACVARLWHQKRLKWAIWSMDVMRRMHPDSHLLIIGDGPQRNRLMRYRQLYWAEEYVHFLGARSDVPRILRAADVLWLSSLYEGQPNAVLEAMALGVPTVSAKIPAVEEFITHEENGFLVDPNDIPGFARWTTHLLEIPGLKEKIASNARETIHQKFDLETMVSTYENLYQS